MARTDVGGRNEARMGAATWDDPTLVTAMRRADDLAFREFVLRFRPYLLDVAARVGAPAGERDALVVDVLVDACARLADDRHPPPRTLAAYLGTALRNRWRNVCRAERRRHAHDVDALAVEVADAADEAAVPSLASDWSRRASRAPDDEPAPLHPALAALAAALAAELRDDEERLVLAWLGHHVPQRLIAGWLGVSYAAASKRIERLRQRLRRAALEHAASLGDAERRVLLAFFRRADGNDAPPPVPDGTRAPRRVRAVGAPASPDSGGHEDERP